MAIWIEVTHNGVVRSHALSIEPITIGRSSKATIKVEDELLSGIHCRMSVRLGRAYLEDLKSKNGVFVNSDRFENGPITLDDIIKIGNARINLVPSKMNDEEKARHKSKV